MDQLAMGGKLVIPFAGWQQDLRVLEKRDTGLRELQRIPVQFVPLVRARPDSTPGQGLRIERVRDRTPANDRARYPAPVSNPDSA